MAFTHLQPAEPTTLGYRLAVYAQDLLIDDTNLRFVFENLTTKGLRGAVGTGGVVRASARSFGSARPSSKPTSWSASACEAREISTQTYPRKLDYLLLSGLAGLGASLSKFAADIRILSSPEFGEVSEPFGKSQVGSSAMPFKRNPIVCERIDSLARLLVGYADVAWQNAATNYLERTLDDSANRRTILPEALLCADEIVSLARKVIDGLRVDERRIAHNLRTYGPFAGTEAVMMEAARAGADRQKLHEAIRDRRHGSVGGARARRGQPALANCSPPTNDLTSRVDPAEIRAPARSRQARRYARRSARACWPIASKRSTHFPVKKWYRRMNKGIEIARGKTKVLYEYPGQPDQLVVAQTDGISAGDGARRERDRGQRPSRGADDRARISLAQPLRSADALLRTAAKTTTTTRWSCAACNMIPLEVVDARRRGRFVRQAQPRRAARRAARAAAHRVLRQRRCQPRSADRARTDRRTGHRQAARSRRDERDGAPHVRYPRPRVAQARRAAGRSEDRVRTARPAARTRASSSSPT